MNIIGDAFRRLFNLILSVFSTLFNVIWEAIKWIGNLLKKLFQSILDVIVGFIKVIYALIDGLLYLLYMIGVLAVKLFLVIFEAAKLLWSLVVGFTRTLASLHYTPRGSSGNGYSSMIGKIFDALQPMQMNVVAYILLFCLWFVTAVAAIKLISSIRVGGD